MRSRTHSPDAADLAYRYSLAGLAVDSEIALPELMPGPGSVPDIHIRVSGEIPRQPDLVEAEDDWWVGANETLFAIPDVGRYLVRGGTEILVEPAPGADSGSIRLFLLGSALGALFHQRGLLPLHAGGIVTNVGCCAFGGDTGAGKSTLTAFLRRRGYRSIADDVLVVEPGAAGPRVQPGYPQTKLWADAACALGIETAGRTQVDELRDKFYVEIDRDTAFCNEPQPFGRFYVLAESDEAPRITRLGNAEAMAELTRNTYRAFLLKPMGRLPAHFNACAELVRGIGVYRLARRRDLAEMDAVLDVLEAHFNDPSA